MKETENIASETLRISVSHQIIDRKYENAIELLRENPHLPLELNHVIDNQQNTVMTIVAADSKSPLEIRLPLMKELSSRGASIHQNNADGHSAYTILNNQLLVQSQTDQQKIMTSLEEMAANEKHAAMTPERLQQQALDKIRDERGHALGKLIEDFHHQSALHMLHGRNINVNVTLANGKTILETVISQPPAYSYKKAEHVTPKDFLAPKHLVTKFFAPFRNIVNAILDRHEDRRYKLAEMLLAQGALPDVGTTQPLRILSNRDIHNDSRDRGHRMPDNRSLALAKLLMNYGADVNVRDGNGETPLHKADSQQNKPLIALLSHGGADANIPNTAGKSLVNRASAQVNDIIKTNNVQHLANKQDADEALDRLGLPKAVENLIRFHAGIEVKLPPEQLYDAKTVSRIIANHTGHSEQDMTYTVGDSAQVTRTIQGVSSILRKASALHPIKKDRNRDEAASDNLVSAHAINDVLRTLWHPSMNYNHSFLFNTVMNELKNSHVQKQIDKSIATSQSTIIEQQHRK